MPDLCFVPNLQPDLNGAHFSAVFKIVPKLRTCAEK